MLAQFPLRGRILALTIGLASLAGGALALLAFSSQPATADSTNNMSCRANVTKGDPAPGDPSSVGVKYTFYCDGPLTGYSILTAPEREIQAVETEVFPTNAKGEVIPTDGFFCNGTFPGWGINCVGGAGQGTGGAGHVVTGTFYVDRNICAEPRIDPVLTVTAATANARGQVIQTIAGPFPFGRPRGCGKARKGAARSKIPKETEQVLTGQEG